MLKNSGRDIIKQYLCRYFYMSRLETSLNILELFLRLNSPPEVKKARFFFDYKGALENDPTMGYGIIKLYVETHNSNFVLEWKHYWVVINEDVDIAHNDAAEALIEDKDYLKVWEAIDFERECWKWE